MIATNDASNDCSHALSRTAFIYMGHVMQAGK
jgi:hypothetical protein